MKAIKVLLLSATLLMMVTTAWADVSKEKEAPWMYSAAEVAPDAGPILNYPPVDDQWDLVFYSNAGQTVNDNQLLGGEFAGGLFYITSGSNGGEPNVVYTLNPDGTYNSVFDQWSSAGWGWRDIAYDGTYLYASDDNVIDAFDLDGNAVPGSNITGCPISPCRALAYDPVEDHFWTQTFSGPLHEIDRSGASLWSGSSGATAYGAAWDDAAPDGPWLWIFSQTGTPNTTFHKFDPVNHVATGFIYQLPLIPGSTDQIAGGAFMTDEWDPSLHVLGGVTQGTPDDMLFCLEMYPAGSGYRPAACENFDAVPDPGGALSADLTWDLPTTTVNGEPIASYPITSVELLRDGAPLVSLGPTATSYTDNVSSVGLYEYRVYAVNDSGDGIPATDTEWIGLDVPGGVENLVGEGVGVTLVAELTWDNPTAGAHGGYWPAGSIDDYTINRYGPDPATFTLTGIATGYTDNTITMQGWYEYGVIANNASGPGPEVISNNFYVGPAEFEEIPYDWVEINPSAPGGLPGTNTGITGDDQNLGPFDLGFVFPFYGGTTFTSIRVCSNGFLSFTSTSTAYSNQSIPNTSEPNNLVAPYWDDMYPPAGGSIWYYFDETNDRFIVEFYQVPHISGTTDFTFEAILYPDGTIDYQYQHLDPSVLLSCTVGIENSDGTVGIQTTYNGSGPLEPRDNMGIRIYPVAPPPPDMDILLVPATYPIQIPATGGSFDFYGFVTNNETSAIEVDLWIDAIIPGGIYVGPLMGPVTANVEPGTMGWFRTQNVPGAAPTGFYEYYAKGGLYPEGIWAMDVIEFEKLETGDGAWIGNWNNWGDLIGDEAGMAVEALPQAFALNPAHPNPFNPTTTISFSLPEAARVTLTVYDVSGRMVTELVRGWRDAGTHEAIFDGTNFASGVYIYNLTAGPFNATGKMVMMK